MRSLLFVVCCLISFTLALVIPANAELYHFSPPNSEFTVVFPEKPDISEYYSYEENECKTNIAQLLLWNQTAGLRAESIICKKHNFYAANKQNTIAMMRDHAAKSGVSDTVYQYSEIKNMKIGSYRGVIAAASNTFVYTAIFGKNSSIVLTGSAPYRQYSDLGYEEFLGSLKYITSDKN